MDKLLLKTQLAFENCRNHLDETNTWSTEIESYLTQHILVIMCADIQQEIYRVVEKRADMTDDSALKVFTVAACKKILRSIGKSDLAGFVGHFGVKAKTHLNEKVDDSLVTIYNNAVSNRHDVAHSSGTNITFRELETAIRAARSLIEVVSEAISLSSEAA